MSGKIHEILAEIGVIHNEMLSKNIIKNADDVFEYIEDIDSDVKEHYLNLLLQYYFQNNDLENLQKLLLVGARFDITFEDVRDAFLNIKSNEENVIEFMEDSVVFIKENNLEVPLQDIYDYYKDNSTLQATLEETLELIKKNRYVCAYCYNHPEKIYSEFFINEDLLESLKRDLPYLLN